MGICAYVLYEYVHTHVRMYVRMYVPYEYVHTYVRMCNEVLHLLLLAVYGHCSVLTRILK